MSISSVSRSTPAVKCSSCGHKTPAAAPSKSPVKAGLPVKASLPAKASLPVKASLPAKPDPAPAKASEPAKPPVVKLKTFAEASKSEVKPVDLKPACMVKNSPVTKACTPEVARIDSGVQGIFRNAMPQAFPPLSSVRFGTAAVAGASRLSAQDLIHAQNARSIAATNPVINSPQALAGPVHPGRGPANLSAVSAPNVRLPPMGMSPEEWAALNGITISWDDSGTVTGAALPDNRHIVMGSQLKLLPRAVICYAMFHEIGHVLAGHSQRQPRPSPVRSEWEHDADLYARQAVTVADPRQDLANKQVIAAWLRTLLADLEHEDGETIAKWLLETVGTVPNSFFSGPSAFQPGPLAFAVAA